MKGKKHIRKAEKKFVERLKRIRHPDCRNSGGQLTVVVAAAVADWVVRQVATDVVGRKSCRNKFSGEREKEREREELLIRKIQYSYRG